MGIIRPEGASASAYDVLLVVHGLGNSEFTFLNQKLLEESSVRYTL